MDIKIGGITPQIFEQALEQARHGRLFILDKMEQTLHAARPELSAFAPRLLTITVPEDKIRDIIGSGGKTIRALQKEYACKIDVQDDGTVTVASSDLGTAEKCLEAIRQLTTVPEIGTEYLGTVMRIEPYGCFVQILPGMDGLVHISELAPGRVRETTDVVKMGDKVKVKIIAIDPVNGKIKLSRRQALTPEESAAEVERLGLTAAVAAGDGDGRPRRSAPLRPRPAAGRRRRLPRRPARRRRLPPSLSGQEYRFLEGQEGPGDAVVISCSAPAGGAMPSGSRADVRAVARLQPGASAPRRPRRGPGRRCPPRGSGRSPPPPRPARSSPRRASRRRACPRSDGAPAGIVDGRRGTRDSAPAVSAKRPTARSRRRVYFFEGEEKKKTRAEGQRPGHRRPVA